MLVKEVMNRDVKTAEPDTTVQDAARIMSDLEIGSLVVVEKSKLVGIVTERDILTKLVAQNMDASETKIKDIMTKKVIMIEPEDDVEKASQIMVQYRIKKLPVVSGSALVGMVSAVDLCTIGPKLVKEVASLLQKGRKRTIAG